MKDEKDLRQRTFAFGLSIIRLYLAAKQNRDAWDLARQFVRSGTSVGAHYREAHRARSNAEFISKMEGALQELDETAYWIELLTASSLLSAVMSGPVLSESEELIRIFVTCVKNAKERS
jgi:four helix bundle protein